MSHTLAHECLPVGIRWTVRDAAGGLLLAATTKAECVAFAAGLGSPPEPAPRPVGRPRSNPYRKPGKREAKGPGKRILRPKTGTKTSFSDAEFDLWLGRRIRDRRQHFGKTMQELCNASGMSRSCLDKVEHGTQSSSIGAIRALCRPLYWTLSEMLDAGDDEQERRDRLEDNQPSQEERTRAHFAERDRRDRSGDHLNR